VSVRKLAFCQKSSENLFAETISFGIENLLGEDMVNVLVFDFGGGTFDLSH